MTKKSMAAYCALVFVLAMGIGLLLESPAEARPFCFCNHQYVTLNGAITASSCDTAALETYLRSQANLYCQANVVDSSGYCNFTMGSVFSCAAIDPGDDFRVGGSATFACRICIDLP